MIYAVECFRQVCKYHERDFLCIHSLQCLVRDHDVKGFTRMKLLVTTLVFSKAAFGGHVCHLSIQSNTLKNL